ncbi:MAG TPA: TerB family tellurite resistance protein [Flavitalea sp.]|nr:TerB family tellurite resistance protein [Flavitalea sp.]
MQTTTTILEGYSDMEKGAYLGALASIATADRSATEQELTYLQALCESANLSEDQTNLIRESATTEISDEDLKRCLDVLKTSELRFSLVSDVIAFAGSDQSYSEEEKQKVQQIAQYLGVNQEQFSLLDQFTKKAVKEVPKQVEALETEQATPSNFLDSLGFGDKLKSAGINSNSLLKGALGIIGPIVLARMLSGRRGSSGGGMLGGGLAGGGGLLGGLLGGGLLGGLLGGGRGFGNAGGMLGRMFGGNRSGW